MFKFLSAYLVCLHGHRASQLD